MDYQIKQEWLTIANKIDEVRKQILDDITTNDYNKWLDILTACYMYLTPHFKEYEAVKNNNEAAKFMEIKNAFKPSESEKKFTAANAKEESQAFTADDRYKRNWLEGWVLAAEQGIRTCKAHLRLDNTEKSF